MAHDNAKIATIIRRSLEEFNAVKPGTVYFDETTDHLYELFQKERSCYFVATMLPVQEYILQKICQTKPVNW